jgi:hypothetical protein
VTRAGLVAIALLLQGVATPGGGIGGGDVSKEDFQHQRPTPSPHTLERACTTRAGICRVANLTPPGQPCFCLAADGTRRDGYVIAWRWTPVPTDIR